MYLKSFEYFRAITITIIVAGHCYGISGWNIDTFPERTLANLISGGTSLFVFISGFLFHHVFYPRYNYLKFLKGKFKNVYIPYLFLSIIPICFSIYTRNPYPEFYFGQTDSFYDQLLRPAFLYLWHGGVMVYWYIPFIMTIFIISPVFIFFIKQNTRFKIVTIAALSVISIFMHRPVNNISIIQSVIYFSPVYMLGILCSMERDWIYGFCKNKNTLLLSLVIFLAALQAATMNTCGNLQKNPFEFNGVDIAFLQKDVMCVFFMNFLRKFEGKKYNVLENIASASFSIYFLHGWVIFLIWMLKDFYEKHFGLYLLPIFTALVLWISYAMAARVKKAFPTKSRLLIGW